nr:immunoglobulin heavy chain junction region [Macaca mulatta]MOW77180.1 immunoglobulin heavy chain junction region [Macaca mulatta]MOW78340.1 immunoglobulin heavy chain junction region [Macaca mulatta]MOW78741.1 immunoglobulin heavy chain junction region [Macaca mulatta]MOW79539.1 immunoglobulin heavy chain junction region [Macaca mulatta]
CAKTYYSGSLEYW